ncbi:cytochrome c-type biogenesis protein CcmH [Alteromonadaceae bacterium BrNp21-10]|nr:cytochrome c-type biogenesis protein CcmH [Alteromonadaceae bacterium BrNp21-10]
MSHCLKSSLLAALVFWQLSMSVLAVQENYVFANPQQHQVFKELTQELRCPRCQNQSIAGSNATVALDMKNKVYAMLREGKTKQEIVDSMKQRYGEFVHYQPPLNAVTSILWWLPLLFVIAGLVMVFRRKPTVAIDNDALIKAQQLLEKDK